MLAAWAATWGAVLGAFQAHRRGAWQLLIALSAVGLACTAGTWVAGAATVPGLVSAAVDAVLLALLLHEDSRDWVRGEPSEPGPGTAGDTEVRPRRTGARATGMPDDHGRPHPRGTRGVS